MSHVIHGKTMENVKNTVYLKLVNNKKDYLKCASKSSYMSHKIFDNNLAEIPKSKQTCIHCHWKVYFGIN